MKRIALFIAFLAFCLGLLVLLYARTSRRSPVVARVADARTDTVRVSFVVPAPAAGPYQLVLAVPAAGSASPASFSGRVTIEQEGKTVLEYPVSSASAEPFGGLRDRGLSGWLLQPKPRKGDGRRGLPLNDGQPYDVTLTFSKPPPEDASVWFHWTAFGWNRGQGVTVGGKESPPYPLR
jgi:hypothetical protein